MKETKFSSEVSRLTLLGEGWTAITDDMPQVALQNIHVRAGIARLLADLDECLSEHDLELEVGVHTQVEPGTKTINEELFWRIRRT